MTVKVGDIIHYKGIEQRLMMCGTHIFRLSHNGKIGGSYHNLELVESVTLPNLEVGDWVIVNDIPIEEKKLYLTPWYGECEKLSHLVRLIKSRKFVIRFFMGKLLKLTAVGFYLII